ncbi:MAG: aminotransferase class V-fold PLP-dependent enzyme [Bdellovibrionales bacterium]
MSIPVEQIKKDFPILDQKIHGKRFAYLDNAATTLKPRAVVKSLADHFEMGTSNIHRGVYFLSEKATFEFEAVRDQVQKFLGAKSRQEIIFTKGTTESINLVAQTFGRQTLKKGDEVLITEMEHHSNIVPWQMLSEQVGCVLKVIPMNDRGEIIFEEFKKLLSSKTKLLSVVYVSNSLGTVNPIEEMIPMARAVGAKTLIDAAQATTCKKINVQELDCDFLTLSAHKMFGPTGVGVLYGKQELLQSMPPYQGGGDMIASVTFEKTIYNELPYKFEAGTPNIGGVIAFGVALRYIENIGLENIWKYESELLAYAQQELAKIPEVQFIGTAKQKGPVISFVMGDIHPHDIGTLLDQEGVAVRTGHHCTQPVMKKFGVPATVRASFSIYNTKEDVDQLVEALKKVVKVFQ